MITCVVSVCNLTFLTPDSPAGQATEYGLSVPAIQKMHLAKLLFPFFKHLTATEQIHAGERAFEKRVELGKRGAAVDGGHMDHDDQFFVEDHPSDTALGEGILIDDADHRGERDLRQTFTTEETERSDAAYGDPAYSGRNDKVTPNPVLVAGEDAEQAIGHKDREFRVTERNCSQGIFFLEKLFDFRAPLRDILPDIPVKMNSPDDAKTHFPLDFMQIFVTSLKRGTLPTGSVLFDFLDGCDDM